MFGRRGRRPGRGGDGGGDGVISRSSSSVGIIAGLNREIETFSGLPPGIAIRNEFSCLEMTRNGPEYGALNEGWMPPFRTITCEAVWSSSGM